MAVPIAPLPPRSGALAKPPRSAQLDRMYKPWPKCPKCSRQTLLIPPKEKGGTVNAYECPECVHPRKVGTLKFWVQFWV
jgi:hypothetical protein